MEHKIPSQKLLLVGVGAAFVMVALVLYLMLRGATEEAAQAPVNAPVDKVRPRQPVRPAARNLPQSPDTSE